MRVSRSEMFARHRDIIDVPEDIMVHVIGCGSIGTATAEWLVRLGVSNMVIWDNDEVSAENISCQGFRTIDIGFNKAQILQKKLWEIGTGCKVVANQCKWESSKAISIYGTQSTYYFVCVDNMATRKAVAKHFKNWLPDSWIIESRMGAEELSVYTVGPNSMKDYLDTALNYNSEDIDRVPCTAKSTGYCSIIAGGYMVREFKNILAKKLDSAYYKVTNVYLS